MRALVCQNDRVPFGTRLRVRATMRPRRQTTAAAEINGERDDTSGPSSHVEVSGAEMA